MEDSRSWIILGNARVRACTLRRYLKKSEYYLRYDFKTACVALWANHGHGGEVIFEADNVPLETAQRFAKELGLEEGAAGSWHKWNPVVRLGLDASADALEIRRTVLEFGIPLIEYAKLSGTWEFSDGQHTYQPPMWTKDKVLGIIRDMASRYHELLSTIP